MKSNYTIKTSDTNPFIDFNEKDLKLVPSFNSISEFRPSIDKVEFSVYNEQGVLEFINYNYNNYSITSGYNSNTGVASELNIDPGKDLIDAKFEQGTYNVVYNFLREKLNTSPDNPLFIQQISSDRTELRLASNIFSNQEIEASTNSFITELNGSPFFEDFYLNFGNNVLSVATNIALDDSDDEQFTIIVKLYEPLPSQLSIKDTLWVVLQTAEVISFEVEFAPKVFLPTPAIPIKGPNFDLKIKDTTNNSNIYQNISDLTSTILTSSKDELKGILNKKGVNIDIDYEDFNNFVYFSSAQTRLENFYYKIGEIEGYKSEINTIKSDITGSTSSSLAVSSSLGILEQNISNIISNFDDYDRFLYYTSGSDYTWPKTTTSAPYTLAATGSSLFTNWYGRAETVNINGQGILGSASFYDENNADRLVNTLPSFVKDDPVNQPFFLFMDMIGQHFDVFWTYTTAIGDRYNADNRLDKGISKDLVADAIRSMGVNLYQNNFSTDDLYSAFVGINASGSLLPPTGSEIIESYVTASSDITKLDDVNKETYKRIFHNLPFLLKTKGTVTGLRALINTYGIPDTILRISEFGGKDINNSNDWDYYQNKFNYAISSGGGNVTSYQVVVPFRLNEDWNSPLLNETPPSVFFRFKVNEDLPTEDKYSLVADSLATGLITITLDYTGSAYLSGSYSGSIPSSSNEYAKLTFWHGVDEILHVNAPFYNKNWWNVHFGRDMSTPITSPANYYLEAAESIYDGGDGYKIGMHVSSSTTATNNNYFSPSSLNFPATANTGVAKGARIYYALTGSYQEIRYYNKTLAFGSSSTFTDYVMNPYSIEGYNYSSSASDVAFRAPLGSDLITGSGNFVSTHPKTTGSYTTSSFANNSTYIIGASATYTTNKEFIYYDQPAVGIKNRVSEKIRAVDSVVPSGDTLTPYRTIQQRYPQSESYTRDVNHVEVAFSPQNEINDDINSSFGYFNIGEYIGDPGQVSESVTSYQDLDKLRDTYFEKYYKSYDWRDYVRLIKYFDNSLFKMIKDFVPAKSSVTTGVVIKQHLLERNKQRPPAVSYTRPEYSGSINSGSIIGTATGGAGGVFNYVNVSGSAITSSVSPQLTQSWAYGVSGKSGTFIITQSSQEEFYNGELSGSDTIATNGEMLPGNFYREPVTDETRYKIQVFKVDGRNNRGQDAMSNIEGITQADLLAGTEAQKSLIGIPRAVVTDVGTVASFTPGKFGIDAWVSIRNIPAVADSGTYPIVFAKYSGSEGGIDYYIASASLKTREIDTVLVDPVADSGGTALWAWFATHKHFHHVGITKGEGVGSTSGTIPYTDWRFASNSFYDYGFGQSYNENENGEQFNGQYPVVFGGSGSFGGTANGSGPLSTTYGWNNGTIVTLFTDEPQIPNNTILQRDILNSSLDLITPDQGYMYIIDDTQGVFNTTV